MLSEAGNIRDGGRRRYVGRATGLRNRAAAVTAIGVLSRATSWFAARGVTVERVLSDNGPAYKSFAWRAACADLGIKHKRTRSYWPQTTGRSNASTAPSPTVGLTAATQRESARRAALLAWLHT